MKDADRFLLVAGPYRPPRTRRGAVLTCLVRDRDCVVTGWTGSPLQWPKGKPKDSRAVSLIVTEVLARAIAVESSIALCRLLGVTAQTITKWRKALGVGRMTAGTMKLFQGHYPEQITAKVFRRAIRRANTPEANTKKAAAKVGVRRPAYIRKILNRKGNVASKETRAKMSASHRKRGTRPPAAGRAWTADEDRAALTLRPAEASKATGRTMLAVYMRRRVLKLRGLA